MSDADTERTVVKTYVPAYQREEWDDHADRLETKNGKRITWNINFGKKE